MLVGGGGFGLGFGGAAYACEISPSLPGTGALHWCLRCRNGGVIYVILHYHTLFCFIKLVFLLILLFSIHIILKVS